MKKSIFTFLSILCFAHTAVAQTNQQTDSTPPAQGWIKLNTGTTASLGSLSVSKTDTLWAGGGAILNSTDAGVTWDSLKGLAGSIYFLDGTTGFLFPGGPSLFKTTDGGGHWRTISTGGLPRITAIVFTGRDSGCIMDGAYTIDGGETWLLSANDQPLPTMHGMSFADAKHGYMVGDESFWLPQPGWAPATSFARTTDGGANWHVVYAGDTLDKSHTGMYSEAFAIAAPSADTIIVGGAAGLIGRSTDAGNTWDTIYSGTNYDGFLGACFPDRSHGTLVGTTGWIMHTTDAGLTWVRQNSGVTVDLIAVSFIDSLHGFATGDSGTVLMTVNGGISWVRLSPPLSESLNGSCYPMPANTSTNYTFVLPESQHVTLAIQNITGTTVRGVLTNAFESSGQQIIPIDTSTLASGTYTYMLQTEKYYSTGKIEVIH